MKQYSKVKMSTLKVDGGATANNFLMQFQADISNLQIERTRSAQVTALGAAALAGIGAGIWKDSSAIQRLTQPDKRFKPKLPRKQRHALCIGWKNALNQVKRERTHQE
jgi:glycerol kinase